MNKNSFYQIVKKNQPKNTRIRDCILAFLGGGLIGVIAQLFIDFFTYILKFDFELSSSLSGIILVLISSLLTYFGLYPKLGQIFGGGLFVPITGFANSMVSSSIEGKPEGYICGIGARVFALSGSVIAYGIGTSVIVVFIRFILSLFGVGL